MDQTVFIQQGGKNRHEHICESLELFAGEVMPEFQRARGRARRAEGPGARALRRRRVRAQRPLKPLADEDIPTYPAYGLTVAQVDLATLPEANRQRALVFRKMREIMERS